MQAIILGLATHRECIESVTQWVALSTQPNASPTLDAAIGSSQNLSRPPPPAQDASSQNQPQPSLEANQGMCPFNSICVTIYARLT